MSARIDTPISTPSDVWEKIKERMSESASKMQLGIRDIGATLLVSIVGSAISIGIFVGSQSNKLEAEKEARLEVERRVVALETARQDLKDHDKLVELNTKMDQLTTQIQTRDSELQRQISEFLRRQESFTAYGVGASQPKGKP